MANAIKQLTFHCRDRGTKYKEVDTKASIALTDSIHKEFANFLGYWMFKMYISLQVKDGTKPEQASLRCMVYVVQEPCIKELEILQRQ